MGKFKFWGGGGWDLGGGSNTGCHYKQLNHIPPGQPFESKISLTFNCVVVIVSLSINSRIFI